MLLIVANHHDSIAPWLAHRWRAHDALVLTPLDLSSAGWRHYVGDCGNSRAIIAGREISSGQINGVVTRMPAVFEWELGHVVTADRQYVAAEMSAFLLAWLSSLSCPMLNRPTPHGLSGPDWNREQWVTLAAKLGIPVRLVHRTSALASSNPVDGLACQFIVVGDRCFPSAASQLCDHARTLAAAADTPLLALEFTGPEPDAKFVNASLRPDVNSPAIADAMLAYLLRSEC
ncbi:MAG: hypothetical protein WAM71_16955 [Candidatus Korobacteraceae bacterium]